MPCAFLFSLSPAVQRYVHCILWDLRQYTIGYLLPSPSTKHVAALLNLVVFDVCVLPHDRPALDKTV
ncbi:hypothetical protein RSOLAG1IB_05323 [Rhizoctonia solani AG-1 IB]|uniref:Uncharacterized protein n=1 Tax=Thanatephorus cucumeris (strain AG1-IB / isolate 7/3/14) TaxID=1108050 RepID=A0A0B7G003_THACB|nr:hypothetical protein RSOLAG1IB_05323 [Rhizoctonia solani AG-1 IB]